MKNKYFEEIENILYHILLLYNYIYNRNRFEAKM